MSSGIGDALRGAREDQGRTHEELAQRLRVRGEQLRALEDERFETFGGDVYAKGFLRSYATELDLDPDPLLDTYRREVSHDEVPTTSLTGVASPKTPRSSGSPLIAWALVAVVIVAGLAFVGSLGGGRTPSSADDPEDPPPASADQADDDADDADGADDADSGDGGDGSNDAEGDDTSSNGEGAEDGAGDGGSGDGDQDEADIDGVELLLALEEDSWMRVTVDGSPVLEEIVTAGATERFEGDEEVEVRFGNAGGVRATLNGEDLGAQGGRGEPLTVTFTPDGAEETA